MYLHGLERVGFSAIVRRVSGFVFGDVFKNSFSVLFIGVSLFSFSLEVYAQTSSYGKPAGVLHSEVPANSQRLFSTPFIPFSGQLNLFLDKQLTGENQASSADRVIVWSPSQQEYITVFKAANTGNSERDGKWFVDDINWVPSTLSVSPGMSFFIQNQHSSSQNVFFMGKLVLDQTKALVLYPDMNLLSYPFSSKLLLNSSNLKNSGAHGDSSQTGTPDVLSTVNPDQSYWLLDNSSSPNDGKWLDSNDQLANVSLSLSNGFWYRRQFSSSFVWSEVRPYQNPFDVAADAPEITGMSINSGLNEVTLTIACTGATGETLEILFKDLTANDSLTTESGWQVAATGIASSGSKSITWTDIGESNPVAPVVSRVPVSSAFMRVYLVSRQDIDSDGDGISDGREKFHYGTDPASYDSDRDGLSDYEELFTYQTNPNAEDSDGDGFSDYLETRIYGSNPNNNASIPSDSQAPSAPTSLTKLAASLSVVSISWTASTDNVAVAGYKIYRNGLEVGRSKEASYVDFRLASDTQYSYTVKAYDHMGNLSDASGSLSVTTGCAGATCCYVDGANGNDSNNGQSWSTAKKTLSAAVNTAVTGTVIIAADGVYVENLELDGKNLIIVSKSGQSKTEIYGYDFASTVSISNAQGSTIIEGFVISGGYALGDGGGISIDSASPVIANCTIKGNIASNGGGVAISGSTARPVIANCVIKENSASSKGGGIFYSQGKPRISACLINSNSALSDGGGIYGED